MPRNKRKRGRRVLRRVKGLVTWGVTRNEYPKDGEYTLECGHIQRGSRPERMRMHQMILVVIKPPGGLMIKCHECSKEADEKERLEDGR